MTSIVYELRYDQMSLLATKQIVPQNKCCQKCGQPLYMKLFQNAFLVSLETNIQMIIFLFYFFFLFIFFFNLS